MRTKEKFVFKKTNINPKGKKVGDCVIRAISYALGESWEDTYKALVDIGIRNCDMPNADTTYQSYLSKRGYTKEKMPKRSDNTRYTVKEFANELADKDKKYIIRVAGHLTVLDGSVLIDTWDCSHKSCGNYWEINK